MYVLCVAMYFQVGGGGGGGVCEAKYCLVTTENAVCLGDGTEGS